ncbi:serine/threonine dehydratase [Streptomyces sp. RFCAC02]|uniref:serine/threonine dehydratase n=1 Tax=Streptomyces sp. RFCAC02 TaxID=2499143 RepID=UPI00101FD2E7|nr:serine/threonine dehydratase [Streptomyces sp. RFCAC02]
MIDHDDIEAAAARVAGHVRPVTVAPAGERRWFALEFLQHTGTFKARGALNFLAERREAGVLPDAGVAIASGGNAGLACAWAAAREGVTATVFVPETAPAVKVARLRRLGADVRQVGREYAEAAAACAEFTAGSGALASHAYDHPLIAAGAGTLLTEIVAVRPGVRRVVVAVGGGGLFSGVAAAAARHGIEVVAVEPEHCRALDAALAAGEPVDVAVDSVAADSLGARRVSAEALYWAQQPHTTSVLVTDEAIETERRRLWTDHHLVVEHAAAAALAGAPDTDDETCVVLCGANTDPTDLTTA